MADRYSYIPSIGLFIAVVWAMRDFGARFGARTPAVVAVAALGICLFLTRRQAAVWTNSATLFEHAIQITTNNYIAYERLGSYEAAQGNATAALRDLETAVKIKPDFALSRDKLGRTLLEMGQIDQALIQLREAVSLDPNLADSHYDLGYALLAKGQTGEALDQFQAQVNLEPDEFKAQNNMGTVLLQNGLPGDAIPFLQKAIKINPSDAGTHYLLGNALFRQGGVPGAVQEFEKAIQLEPGHIQARNDLAWILACHTDPSVRNGARAVELALRADQLSGGTNPVVIGTLAAGYAEAGKFAEAVEAGNRARQVALARTNSVLAESLEKRLRSYQAGSPWRDTGGASSHISK